MNSCPHFIYVQIPWNSCWKLLEFLLEICWMIHCKLTGGKKRKEQACRSQTQKSPAATYFPARRAVSSAQEGLTSVFGMGTGIAPPPWPPGIKTREKERGRTGSRAGRTPRTAGTGRRNVKPSGCGRKQQYGQASRPVSNARLNASRRLHLHPINQIVSLEPSGGSSPLGSQVLRRASRLDAFSGYPFRT